MITRALEIFEWKRGAEIAGLRSASREVVGQDQEPELVRFVGETAEHDEWCVMRPTRSGVEEFSKSMDEDGRCKVFACDAALAQAR